MYEVDGDLTMTCGMCPRQLEGTLKSGEVIYIRYRHSVLEIWVAPSDDELFDNGDQCILRIVDEDDGYLGTISSDDLRRKSEHLIQYPDDMFFTE